jgi:hypothetical protein
MSKNGLILLTPTSIAYTGTSATVSANGSVSLSAVSSLSLNGVFTADYDNYTVVYSAKCPTSTVDGLVRLRSSGTDATGSDYTWQTLTGDGLTVSASRVSSQGYSILMPFSSTQNTGGICFFYGPFLSQPTAFRLTGMVGTDNGRTIDRVSTHSLSSSYDGFSVTITGNTVTGRVAVYGMRK